MCWRKYDIVTFETKLDFKKNFKIIVSQETIPPSQVIIESFVKAEYSSWSQLASYVSDFL